MLGRNKDWKFSLHQHVSRRLTLSRTSCAARAGVRFRVNVMSAWNYEIMSVRCSSVFNSTLRIFSPSL